jgi:ABC-type nitrate/sulfonate/bicarbonate transport system substrate-binding protein
MAKTKKKQSPTKSFFSLKNGFVVILLFLFGLFGTFFLFNNQEKQLKTVKVSLVWLHQAQFAGVYTAIEKGFYHDVGLNVELEEFEYGKQLEEELVTGKTDFSIMHSVRMLEGVAKGLDIKAVATIYQTSPHAFISAADNAISKPQDLVGKTLGIKGDNHSGKLLYSVMLADLGISEADVTFKSLDFSTTELQDIVDGTVDMIDLYRTDQVYRFVKNDVNYQLFPPEDFRFNMYGDVIATSGEMIKNDPETVQKFVDATLKGWKYALENQEEALAYTEQYITSKDYQDSAHNKFILENSTPLIKNDEFQIIGSMNGNRWTRLYNVMKANKLFEQDFNIEDAFTLQFIE